MVIYLGTLSFVIFTSLFSLSIFSLFLSKCCFSFGGWLLRNGNFWLGFRRQIFLLSILLGFKQNDFRAWLSRQELRGPTCCLRRILFHCCSLVSYCFIRILSFFVLSLLLFLISLIEYEFLFVSSLLFIVVFVSYCFLIVFGAFVSYFFISESMKLIYPQIYLQIIVFKFDLYYFVNKFLLLKAVSFSFSFQYLSLFVCLIVSLFFRSVFWNM